MKLKKYDTPQGEDCVAAFTRFFSSYPRPRKQCSWYIWGADVTAGAALTRIGRNYSIDLR